MFLTFSVSVCKFYINRLPQFKIDFRLTEKFYADPSKADAESKI